MYTSSKAPLNVNQTQNENGFACTHGAIRALGNTRYPQHRSIVTTTFPSIIDQLAHAAEEAEYEGDDDMVSTPPTEINPNTPLQIPI